MARMCITGYAFKYEGKRNWKRSSSEKWGTVMVGKVHCGRYVGTRTIDGSKVEVTKVRGKFYAQLPGHAKKR